MTRPDVPLQLQAGLGLRVYLSVPYNEKDQAKVEGAIWDAVCSRWWIDRQAIATRPVVYRWITDNPALRKQAKDAHDWLSTVKGRSARRPERKVRRQGKDSVLV